MSEAVYHAACSGRSSACSGATASGWVAAAGGGLLLGYAGIVRSVASRSSPSCSSTCSCAASAGARCRLRDRLAGGRRRLRDAFDSSTARRVHPSGGRFLYAEVAPFADCAKLGACRPLSARCARIHRPLSTNAYLWGKRSPIRGLPDSADRRLRDFASG